MVFLKTSQNFKKKKQNVVLEIKSFYFEIFLVLRELPQNLAYIRNFFIEETNQMLNYSRFRYFLTVNNQRFLNLFLTLICK